MSTWTSWQGNLLTDWYLSDINHCLCAESWRLRSVGEGEQTGDKGCSVFLWADVNCESRWNVHGYLLLYFVFLWIGRTSSNHLLRISLAWTLCWIQWEKNIIYNLAHVLYQLFLHSSMRCLFLRFCNSTILLADTFIQSDIHLRAETIWAKI